MSLSHFQAQATSLVSKSSATRRFLSLACFPAAFLALLVLVLSQSLVLANEPTPLEKIKARGVLKVAIYDDFAPFYNKGKGIEVDLAQALAQALSLKLQVLPFLADDNLNDDLRNMVWKGHYLGHGPADVMLHVPVDRRLMDDNKQVLIFAPYFKESVGIAHDVAKIPRLESLEIFSKERIGVEGTSLGAMVMAGADSGRYRNQVAVYKTPEEAAQALMKGEVPAMIANKSELQAFLKGDKRFAIVDVPSALPAVRQGTAVGMSVKRDNEALAKLLIAALHQLQESGELKKMFQAHGVEYVRP